jgi:hypothetical protein
MSLKTLNLMSDKSAPYLMKKLPRLYSLSPWRERVRACPVLDTGVRGINLHAILDTRYSIRIWFDKYRKRV